jgi:hypothetical protein
LWGDGKLDGMQENQPPEHRGRSRLVVPSRSDVLLRNFTEVVGGPLGSRSAPGIVSPGIFTVERVLILLTVLAALAGILVKGYCRVNGWESPTQFYATCYSDFPDLFRNRGLAEGTFPVLGSGSQFEYPVLTALIAGVTAWLVPGNGISNGRVLAYFDINVTLLAAVTVVTVLATARMTSRRPWDAAMVALAPGIVLAGTINWDMWAVAMLALGMYFFSRQRLVLAGVLIGLGAATKFYPLLVLGAILLLALRTGRFRPLLVTAGTAAASWLAANLPFVAANPAGWIYFFQFSAGRDAGYSSPWFAYNLVADRVRLDGTQPVRRRPFVPWPFFAVLRGDSRSCPDCPAPAPPGPARLPDRGGVHPHRRVLLATVRGVADPPACPGTAAMAGIPDLAGH